MIQMKLETYLADPCCEPSLDSSTCWTLISRSPKHAWNNHPRLNPNRVRDDANSAMDIGAAAHAMLLEKDESRFVVIDAKDWRTKAAQQARDEAHAQDKIPLLPEQYAKVLRIVEQSLLAIQRCTELGELAPIQEHPICEHVCLWQEGETWCRARPDLVSADYKVLLNYKTTGASASPDRFGAMMIRDGYHIQAYHHARGIAAETGEMPTCLWLAQETDPPYAASILGASPAMMALASAQWDFALRTWRECRSKDEWPAYPDRVCWIEPKPWELERWAMRPDIDAGMGWTCRAWNENRELCGSRDSVILVEGVPYCAACQAKRAGIEQEIFG